MSFFRKHVRPRSLQLRAMKALHFIIALSMVANASFVGAWSVPTALANTTNDFHQAANNVNPDPLGTVTWIGSILQQSNSRYFEGMSTPQRIIFQDVEPNGTNEHSVTFSHQANKGSIHAYDFLTSWDQAVAAANDIAPGQGLLSGLASNPCGDALSATGATACNSLISSGVQVDVDVPDAMQTVDGDDVAARVAAYEAQFGNRTIRVFGNAPITDATLTFDGYTGSTDKDANYTLSWTSTATDVMIQAAAHLSVTGDGTGVSYLAPEGSANISGGPYHFHLHSIDGDTTGQQDNQIKGADIVLSPAHLIVNKVTIPANDPTLFSVTASGTGTVTAPATQNTSTATPAEFIMTEGTYSVTENVPAGWSQTSNTCQNVVLAAGETKTCTITNTLLPTTGTLTVIKNVINDNGGTNVAADFTMSINGITATGGNSFPGDEAGTSKVVTPGAYTVTESGPLGYADSYSADCAGTIAAGESKTCTITNTDLAPQLTVIKNVINDDGGTLDADDFTMNVTGTNVSNPSFPGSSTGMTVTLNAGSYAADETAVPGYVKSLSPDCAGTIAIGEMRVCTITNNDAAASLTVIKNVINNNGGTRVAGDFTMNVTGTNVSNPSFPGDENGTTVSLSAGSYSVDESAMSGYTKSLSADCAGTIANGEHKTCTVTNDDDQGTLIVHKMADSNIDGSFDLDDTGANNAGMSWKLVAGSNNAFGTGLNLDAGAYNVDETAPAYHFVGWYTTANTQFSCANPEGTTKPVAVNVANGETTEITLCNVRNSGTITVNKEFDDNGDGQVDRTNPQGWLWTLNPGATQHGGGDTVSKITGNYIISEDAITGYSSTWECTESDPTAPGPTSGSGTTIARLLHANENIVCTFRNTLDVTTIGIVKDGPSTIDLSVTDIITYTIAWNVNGNTPATGAIIQDVIPANTAYVTGSASCGTTTVSGAATCDIVDFTSPISWSLGTRNPSESGTVTFDVRVLGPLTNGTVITNTAVFDTNENDPVPDDAVTTVISAPIITIDKNGPATATAGTQFTYTIDWSVTGTAPATDVVITDTLPANTTFVSADNGGILNAGVVTWNLGTVTPNDNGTVTVTVQVHSPLANGTVLTNVACIDSTENDQVCDTTTTTVQSQPTISLDKQGQATVGAGATLTYTLAWFVGGNAPVTNAVISDTLPANTTFVSADAPGIHANGIVTWNLGNLVPGDNGVVSVTVAVANPIQNGTVLTNTACFDTNENDPACDTTTTTVQSAPSISIAKTNNITTFVNPGATVTYTVTITNSASATDSARDVVMTDTLPAGFTFVDGGTSTKTFNVGTLVPGQSVTLTYAVIVSTSQAAGTYTNTAKAKGSNTPEVTAVSNVEVRVPQVLGSTTPDLTIVKTVKPTVTKPGATVKYTIVVKNVGDGDATNVVVTDHLPKYLSFVGHKGSTRSWNLGTLVAGASKTITYSVKVSDDAERGVYENIAIVSADDVEPVQDNARIEVRMPQVKGLAITGVAPLFPLAMSALALIALGGVILAVRKRFLRQTVTFLVLAGLMGSMLVAIPSNAAIFTPDLDGTSTDTVRSVGTPKTISIPKLNITTKIESKRLNSKGIMESPSTKSIVAWYKYGVRPGESGGAVLSGHLNSFTGAGVFRSLGRLKAGDTVKVKDSKGKTRTFKVTKLATYKASAAPISALTKTGGKKTIHLVTCAGAWNWFSQNYSHRLIVTAELVK